MQISMYKELFVVFCIPISIIFIVIKIFIMKKNNKNINIFNELIKFLFLLYLLGLFLITSLSVGVQNSRLNLIPFVDMYRTVRGIRVLNQAYAVSELFYNVLLFVPFGLFTTLIQYLNNKIQPRRIFLFGLILTVFIESFQLFIPKGRIANIDDVILNMLGVSLGYILCIVSIKIYKKLMKA